MKYIAILLVLFAGVSPANDTCANYTESQFVEVFDPDSPSVRYITFGPATVFSVNSVDGHWQTQINGHVIHDGLATEQEADEVLTEFVESLF